MNPNLKELASVIDECNKHIEKISSNYPELKEMFPLDDNTLSRLSDDEVRLLDQFLYRFSMLQDAMGQRLFPALLHSLDQDVNSMPFADMVNKDKVMDVVTSKEEWLFLRKLRQEFSHGYNNRIKENAKSYNHLFERTHYIYDTFVKIKNYSLDKFDDLKVNSGSFQTPAFPSNN